MAMERGEAMRVPEDLRRAWLRSEIRAFVISMTAVAGFAGCSSEPLRSFDTSQSPSEIAVEAAKNHTSVIGGALIEPRVARNEAEKIRSVEFWFIPSSGMLPSSRAEKNFVASMSNFCSAISGRFSAADFNGEIVYVDESVPRIQFFALSQYAYLTESFDCWAPDGRVLFRLYYNTDDRDRTHPSADIVKARVLLIEPTARQPEKEFLLSARREFARIWNSRWLCELVPRKKPWRASNADSEVVCM